MRSYMFRERITSACTVVILLAGCRGGAPTENNIMPPPPPPIVPETLSVSVSATVVIQADGTFINISATATSTKGPVSPGCLLDGVTVVCGMVPAGFAGTRQVCAIAQPLTSTTVSKNSCISLVVPQISISLLV